MSCITQLLKMKGNDEFMRVSPEFIIEGGGEYKGYEYLVTFVHHHRCGYVAIPVTHPLHEVPTDNEHGLTNYLDDEDLYVHGGITFHSFQKPIDHLLSTPCNEKWIGFDAIHAGDAYDWDTCRKYDMDVSCSTMIKPWGGDTVRDYAYMESECKQLIDQLIDMEAA